MDNPTDEIKFHKLQVSLHPELFILILAIINLESEFHVEKYPEACHGAYVGWQCEDSRTHILYASCLYRQSRTVRDMSK